MFFFAAIADVDTIAPVDNATTVAGQHDHCCTNHSHRYGTAKSFVQSPETHRRFEGGFRQGALKW